MMRTHILLELGHGVKIAVLFEHPTGMGYTSGNSLPALESRYQPQKGTDLEATETDLGLESSFSKFPVLIKLEEESFYLVRGRKGYLLLSTECPHSGGRVSDQGKTFMCPDHGWRFEHTQGECMNGPNARMFSFPVTVREGHLIADIT